MSTAADAPHQPVGRQQGQPVANRVARGGKALGQRTLGRQAVARRVAAGRDQTGDMIADPLGRKPGPHLSPPIGQPIYDIDMEWSIVVPDAPQQEADRKTMRLVSIRTGDRHEPRLGVETAAGIRDLSGRLGTSATVATVAAMTPADRAALEASLASLPLVSGATILAPIPRRRATSSASARTTTSMPRNSPTADSMPPPRRWCRSILWSSPSSRRPSRVRAT